MPLVVVAFFLGPILPIARHYLALATTNFNLL